MGRFDVHEGSDTICDFIEGVDFKRQLHAARGAKLIDEDLGARVALDVLEQESRAAHAVFGGAAFADAVGDLGYFENGIGFSTDFAEFAGAVERGDPVAEIVVGQAGLRETEDYTGGNPGSPRDVLPKMMRRRVLLCGMTLLLGYVVLCGAGGVFVAEAALHPGRKVLLEADRKQAELMAQRQYAEITDTIISGC